MTQPDPARDAAQLERDGQDQADVDVESLIGEEFDPPTGLAPADPETFDEEPDDGFGDDDPAEEIDDIYVDFDDDDDEETQA